MAGDTWIDRLKRVNESLISIFAATHHMFAVSAIRCAVTHPCGGVSAVVVVENQPSTQLYA